MTTKNLSKLILGACLLIPILGTSLEAAQRAKTFDDAIAQAGDDGVIAYCYGPDWNVRSNRMLRSFWQNNPDLEEAAGNAVLVAVPFYVDSYSSGADTAAEIQGSMPAPKRGICPSVLMFDKNGRLYASLIGGDFLIRNQEEEMAEFIKSRKTKMETKKPISNEEAEQGQLGVANIKKYLGYLRQQQELMKQAESKDGAEKAKLITQASELPIAPPEGYKAQLNDAVPIDDEGYVKRAEYSALAFMYEQLETSDGFLKDDFFEDEEKISRECQKIYKTENLRAADRQAAMNLSIGAMRRAAEKGGTIKTSIRNSQRVDPNTNFGLLYTELSKLWGSGSGATAAERRALSDKKKAQEKIKKANETRDRKASERFTIE